MNATLVTLESLHLSRTDLLTRAASNARYARANWQDGDERWESLNAARALLKDRKRTGYTPDEMRTIVPWGMLSPCDEMTLAGINDAPEPVVQGAIWREKEYNRVMKHLREMQSE